MSVLLLFLHIALIFAGILLAYGSDLLLHFAIRRDDVSAVRGVIAASHGAAPLVLPLLVAGSVFGVLTAVSFGYDLRAPWLVIAYVVFGLQGFLANVPDRAWLERLRGALVAAPDGPLTPELRRVFADRRFRIQSLIGYIGIAVLLFDMVAKPFS